MPPLQLWGWLFAVLILVSLMSPTQAHGTARHLKKDKTQKESKQEKKNKKGKKNYNTVLKTDVVIVGAGAAGIEAAVRLQEQAPELDFVILESTHRVGGRVQSVFNVGANGNEGWTIEDGAMWLNRGSPVYELAKSYGTQMTQSDFMDFEAYLYDSNDKDEPAKVVTGDQFDNALANFVPAITCLGDQTDKLWAQNSTRDVGFAQMIEECGYNKTDPLEYLFKWQNSELPWGSDKVSLFAYGLDPNSEDNATQFLVVDPLGAEHLIQTFAKDNNLESKIKLNHRVIDIKYDVHEDDYRAKVSVKRGDSRSRRTKGSPFTDIEILAKRVIVTVAAGVLNKELIRFDPPLTYPADTYNPMKMDLFTKVFFQFPTKFWDDREYIMALKEQENNGRCIFWLNADGVQDKDFLPGSRVVVCILTTNDMMELLQGSGSQRKIPQKDLLGLLDPLRRVYGNDFREPVAWHYKKWYLDIDTGYGAYANWRPGYTPKNYFQFYGAGQENEYIEGHCLHNGCNAPASDPSAEWILYLAGSASCLGAQEFITGAKWSGQTKADYALQSLGYELGSDWSDPCLG